MDFGTQAAPAVASARMQAASPHRCTRAHGMQARGMQAHGRLPHSMQATWHAGEATRAPADEALALVLIQPQLLVHQLCSV